MRDPEQVARAQHAAARLETAWERWRSLQGMADTPPQPVVGYVGYALKEPWGQPRAVIGFSADEAERLAEFLEHENSDGQPPQSLVPAAQPAPQAAVSGPLPQAAVSGPPPQVSASGPPPRVSASGPLPQIVVSGPLPKVSTTGPQPTFTPQPSFTATQAAVPQPAAQRQPAQRASSSRSGHGKRQPAVPAQSAAADGGDGAGQEAGGAAVADPLPLADLGAEST